MRKRKNTDPNQPFRLVHRKGRSIAVVFDHRPWEEKASGKHTDIEAIEWAMKELEADGIGQKAIPTLEEFAKDFYTRTDKASIQYRQKAFRKENRPQWYITNQRYLENYIIPRFGKYPLNSITTVSIENWIVDFRGKGKEDLSGGTRVKVLQCLRNVLDDAVRLGYIKGNPAKDGMTPSDKPEEERRALTLWEQNQLFPLDPDERVKVWGSLMWATYFSIMYDTGFRPQEVAGLQLADLYQSPKGMAVYTSHTMNAEQKKPLPRVKTSGKGMEQRVGLLSRQTESLVVEFIQSEQIEDEGDYIFLMDRRRKDSYIFPATSNKHFKAVAKRTAGIDQEAERVTQYSLRHTFTTYRRGNVDDQTLALVMGHSNGVRDNYDHRDAVMVISQLDKSREQLFERKEDEVVPLSQLLAK